MYDKKTTPKKKRADARPPVKCQRLLRILKLVRARARPGSVEHPAVQVLLRVRAAIDARLDDDLERLQALR